MICFGHHSHRDSKKPLKNKDFDSSLFTRGNQELRAYQKRRAGKKNDYFPSTATPRTPQAFLKRKETFQREEKKATLPTFLTIICISVCQKNDLTSLFSVIRAIIKIMPLTCGALELLHLVIHFRYSCLFRRKILERSKCRLSFKGGNTGRLWKRFKTQLYTSSEETRQPPSPISAAGAAASDQCINAELRISLLPCPFPHLLVTLESSTAPTATGKHPTQVILSSHPATSTGH